jgi:hypothetical protein
LRALIGTRWFRVHVVSIVGTRAARRAMICCQLTSKFIITDNERRVHSLHREGIGGKMFER